MSIIKVFYNQIFFLVFTDLLSSWEDLLVWSENAAAARKMQEDMIILKNSFNRLGSKTAYQSLDTEPSIQIAIEALKVIYTIHMLHIHNKKILFNVFQTEKSQLQEYRTKMLRLNASVHSWLTRQERKLQAAQQNQLMEEIKTAQATTTIVANEYNNKQDHEIETLKMLSQSQSTIVSVTDNNGNEVDAKAVAVTSTEIATSAMVHSFSSDQEKASQLSTLVHSESEFHKHLKDEVGDMYSAWDEADAR